MVTFRIITRPRQWIILAATIVASVFLTAAISVADNTPHFTFTQGTVEIDYPSGAQTAAANGTAVSPSDYVTTGAGSQAEIQIDANTAIRLGQNSQVRVPDASGERRMQIATGTVELTIFRSAAESIEMDTPSVTVSARESGAYRISVNDNGQTNVTVRRGHAEVITPGHTYELNAGSAFVAYGSASNPKTAFAAASAYDAFDDFNAQRDNQYRDDQYSDEAQQTTETPQYVESSDVVVGAPVCGFGPSVGYYGYGWGLSLGFDSGCPAYTDAWFAPWYGWYGYGYGYPWYPVAYGVPYPYPYPNPTPRPHRWHARTPVPPRRRERDGGRDVFGTPVRLASHSVRTEIHDVQARQTLTVAIHPHTATMEQHRVATVQQRRVAQTRPVWERPITTGHDRPVPDRPVSDAWDRFDRARGSAGENVRSTVDGPRMDVPRIDTPRIEAPRIDAARIQAPPIQAPPSRAGGMRPPTA